jgi:hypothetical protein
MRPPQEHPLGKIILGTRKAVRPTLATGNSGALSPKCMTRMAGAFPIVSTHEASGTRAGT